jgi:hypothetical protein
MAPVILLSCGSSPRSSAAPLRMILTFALAVGSASAMPSSAAAQAPEPTYAPPPPVQTTSIVIEASTPPLAAEPRVEDGARVRFSLGITGGGFFGDVVGGMGGLYGQLGLQLNGTIAIYYQVHGMLGGFVSGGDTGSIGALLWNSVLFEVTLANIVQLGIGPALDAMAGCAASVEGAGCGSGFPFFGLDGRVALALGGTGPGTRGGFVIGFDVHPTFIDGGVSIGMVGSIGGQVY